MSGSHLRAEQMGGINQQVRAQLVDRHLHLRPTPGLEEKPGTGLRLAFQVRILEAVIPLGPVVDIGDRAVERGGRNVGDHLVLGSPHGTDSNRP